MSLFKIIRLGLPLILAGALLLPARVAYAASYTWDGCIDSDWNNARNWVPEGIPGPNDTITVRRQTLCGECSILPCPPPTQSNPLNGSGQTVAGFNLDGGTVQGDFTVSSSTVVSNWTGGIAGTVTIAPGTVVNIGTLSLTGTVNNNGTVNLPGYITGTSTGAFNNAGIFNVQIEDTFFTYESPSKGYPTFNNTGTFNKTSGTGIATFRFCNVNNSGTFNVTTGIVRFSYLIGLNLLDGARFTGAGLHWEIEASPVGVSGTVVLGTAGSNSTLNLSGNTTLRGTVGATFTTPGTGVINGGGWNVEGEITIGKNIVFNWIGSNIKGQLNIAAGSQLVASENVVLSGIINNAGTATFADLNRIFTWNTGAQFINRGTFNAGFVFNTGGAATFDNSGTINVPAGATLYFDTHIKFILNDGSRINGPGTVSADQFTLKGNATVSGTLQLRAGVFTGYVDPGTGATPATLTTTGSGLVNWAGGDLTGTFTIAPGSKLNLTSTNLKNLRGATLNNKGIITWTGAGLISSGSNPSTLNNLSGGVLNVQTDESFFRGDIPGYDSAFPPTLNNAGTVNKSASTGTSDWQCILNNSSAVNVSSGVLHLSGGGTHSGTFNAGAGTAIHFAQSSGGSHAFNTGTKFTGAGNHRVQGGAIVAGAATVGTATLAGNLEVAAGGMLTGGGGSLATIGGSTINWTGGTMGATVNIAAGGRLNISGTEIKTMSGGAINNAGIATWTGTGNIIAGGAISNQVGGVFNVQNNSAVQSGNNSGGFNNAGTLNKTSDGTSNWQVPFNNNAAVNVSSGTLRLGAGGTQRGTFTAIQGTEIEFANDTGLTKFEFETGTQFTGAGISIVKSQVTVEGSVVVGSSTAPGTLEIEADTLRSATGGRLSTTGSGIIEWSKGRISTDLNIAAGGRLNVVGFDGKIFDSGTLSNTGIVNWTGAGDIQGNNGATIINQAGGVFNVIGNRTFSYGGSGGIPIFRNSGTLHPGGASATGTFTVLNGNYTQTSTGVLKIEIGGATPGTEYDQLVVTAFGGTPGVGIATLAGTLGASLINGFSPAVGSSFQAMIYAAHSGTFAGLPQSATLTVNTRSLQISYNANDVVLSVVPSITINNMSVTEGSGTPVNATFTVQLSAASTQTITVRYTTANMTATAPADYTATSGTLIFNAGQTSKSVTVPVHGDLLDEDNETFNVNLSSATNAGIVDGQGSGTITDDDAPPSLAVTNPRAFKEGSAAVPGSTTLSVLLSAPSGKRVTVAYATANGVVNGAIAGSDYVARSGTLIFEPGQVRKSVVVTFIGDAVAELNEPFFLDIKTPLNATIADSRGSAYIGNDDGPAITIDNAKSVTEGSTIGQTTPQQFVVKLSAPSTNTITVDFATANGTAGPADYTVTSGRLTFAPGETQKTITVLVKQDTTVEPNETYRVNLTRPTFATIGDSQGIGYIINDDMASGSVISD